MVLVFYDLETTGFSREHNDVIEIAAAAWDSKTDTIIDTFSTYIKPTTRIPDVIEKLTGITNLKVRNCPGYWDAAPTFFAWLTQVGCEKLAGYNNATFDSQFVVAQNKRYKLDFNWQQYEQIDILKIVRKLKKEGCPLLASTKDVKQTTIAAALGIEYGAHDAIEDVRALIEIYKIIRKHDPTLI